MLSTPQSTRTCTKQLPGMAFLSPRMHRGWSHAGGIFLAGIESSRGWPWAYWLSRRLSVRGLGSQPISR
jgi:hypothetical protein